MWGAHWRHLANTIEPSACGGDAVLCQITLTTCYFYTSLFCPFFCHIDRCIWKWIKFKHTYLGLFTINVMMMMNRQYSVLSHRICENLAGHSSWLGRTSGLPWPSTPWYWIHPGVVIRLQASVDVFTSCPFYMHSPPVWRNDNRWPDR